MGKFAWFILGLILGAAIALAAVTMTGRVPYAAQEDVEPQAVTRIPRAPDPAAAEQLLQPAPVPPQVRRPAEALERRRPAAAPEDEAQVAEDAAAAGMTSRSRRNEPASAPVAPDELPPYP